MKILAIDTSLDACSAAIYDSAEDRMLAYISHDMRRGHAEALVPIIGDVMKAADLGFDAIERIATTVGPGSYTGLRVCISAAKGISLASGKPAVGVTTLAALTAPLIANNAAIPAVAVVDARHGNVYFHMAGANNRVLIPPRVASIDSAIRAIAIGPVRLVGPGAALLNERWPRDGGPAPLSIDPRPAPNIEWVAKLAVHAEPSRSPVKPLYLRPADVTPQDGHRIERQ